MDKIKFTDLLIPAFFLLFPFCSSPTLTLLMMFSFGFILVAVSALMAFYNCMLFYISQGVVEKYKNNKYLGISYILLIVISLLFYYLSIRNNLNQVSQQPLFGSAQHQKVNSSDFYLGLILPYLISSFIVFTKLSQDFYKSITIKK